MCCVCTMPPACPETCRCSGQAPAPCSLCAAPALRSAGALLRTGLPPRWPSQPDAAGLEPPLPGRYACDCGGDRGRPRPRIRLLLRLRRRRSRLRQRLRLARRRLLRLLLRLLSRLRRRLLLRRRSRLRERRRSEPRLLADAGERCCWLLPGRWLPAACGILSGLSSLGPGEVAHPSTSAGCCKGLPCALPCAASPAASWAGTAGGAAVGCVAAASGAAAGAAAAAGAGAAPSGCSLPTAPGPAAAVPEACVSSPASLALVCGSAVTGCVEVARCSAACASMATRCAASSLCRSAACSACRVRGAGGQAAREWQPASQGREAVRASMRQGMLRTRCLHVHLALRPPTSVALLLSFSRRMAAQYCLPAGNAPQHALSTPRVHPCTSWVNAPAGSATAAACCATGIWRASAGGRAHPPYSSRNSAPAGTSWVVTTNRKGCRQWG